MQQDKNGGSHLVLCGSRSLKDAERNYATVKLESAAICWAMQKCKHYLIGMRFSVVTDHSVLVPMYKQPLNKMLNARVLRHREKLSNFSFNVEWIPGKHHELADALSRNLVFKPQDDEEDQIRTLLCKAERVDPLMVTIIADAQHDLQYQAIITALSHDKPIEAEPQSNIFCELLRLVPTKDKNGMKYIREN